MTSTSCQTSLRSQDQQETRRFTRGRSTRGKGLRNTTGCLSCRRRRIKCDEAKPSCVACNRKRIDCEYSNGNASSQQTCRDSSPVEPTSKNNHMHHRGSNHDGNAELALLQAAQYQQLSGETTREFNENRRGSTELHTIEAPHQSYHENNVGIDDAGVGNEMVDDLPQPHGYLVVSPQATLSSQSSHMRPIIQHEGLSPSPQSLYPSLQFGCQSDSATSHFVESPTSRWLDLLINDATLTHGPLPDFEFDANGLNIFGNTAPQTPMTLAQPDAPPAGSLPIDQPSTRSRNPTPTTCSLYLRERLPCPGSQIREEKKAWEASEPIELQAYEGILFRHFVQHISQWMDLFEPHRPFGTLVPHLALHNVGLMNAILALAARHLSLDGCDIPSYAKGFRPSSNDAIGYYYKTLHYSQKAMQYDTYKTSLELLAISIIVSSYEMLDGSSANWQKHLKGVFWIQRSQVIHGDSGGLRQAVWWAWICQDVWAAFREKRKPFTFWRPTRTLDDLDPGQIAARSVHNFAKVLAFCSQDEASENGKDPATRKFEAKFLLEQLEQWKSYLTVEFNPLPISASPEATEEPFAPVWVQPAAFGVAMQVYYCSIILVHLYRPLSGGLDEYLDLQRELRKCAHMICSIAMTLEDYASSVMSSQCVFIAGMTIEDRKQRKRVLELLESCKKRTGWPGNYSLGHDLREIWQRTD